MTVPARQPQGIPAGGQFAPDTHAEPDLGLGAGTNRFADVDTVRDLDHAATAALQALGTADGTPGDGTPAGQVRADWMHRREEILNGLRRQEFAAYARRREEEASLLLASAARADLRNIADELRTEHPQAAKITLARDYDDGNLAVFVASVQDEDGNALPDEVVDAAQELVSEHSSRQLARFVDESPIDLAAAAAWTPPGRPGALFG